MGIRDLVDTVVIVMMENRSFDHMLGHLAYEGLLPDVDGVTAPLRRDEYLNPGDDGRPYYPWVRPDGLLTCDLPHEWNYVEMQLGAVLDGRHAMDGFVKAYGRAAACKIASDQVEPLGFCRSGDVPVSSFLARSFACCDRWFCPIPTSTQPNKTVALTGDTPHFASHNGQIRGAGEMLPEWLERHDVRWRLYQESLSFFLLYQGKEYLALGPHARFTRDLLVDFRDEPDATFPQVVIVEPGYGAIGFVPGLRTNDNHAPLAVAFGEEFLRRVYTAVTANPARWAKTVMILTYDEHGGFWDHVPPPAIPFEVAPPDAKTFQSMGPRVPGIVVSPLVEGARVCHALLDHTSILQLIGELFAGGRDQYSDRVSARMAQGVESISVALTRTAPVAEAPPPAPPPPLTAPALLHLPFDPNDVMQSAFADAAGALLTQHPAAVHDQFPELVQWQHERT